MPGSANYGLNITGSGNTMGTSSLRLENRSSETVFETRDDSYTNHFLANAGMVIHNPIGESNMSFQSSHTAEMRDPYVFGNLIKEHTRILLKKQAKIIRPLSLR